jgi:thioredoxin reductase (NADPH)
VDTLECSKVWTKSAMLIVDGLLNGKERRHRGMIGADPNTAWLDGYLSIDEKGFIKTGTELRDGNPGSWDYRRQPYTLETNKPEISAAGDVRSKSVKRVASAVGEGSVCVQYLHAYLGEDI